MIMKRIADVFMMMRRKQKRFLKCGHDWTLYKSDCENAACHFDRRMFGVVHQSVSEIGG